MITSPLETSVQVLGSGSDNVPAPVEKQIDIQSLLSKLSSLLQEFVLWEKGKNESA